MRKIAVWLYTGAFAVALGGCSGGVDKEICSNGQDEDEDGLVDCSDGDCAGYGHCKPSYCGDGKLNPGEDCEPGDLGGADCASLGFDGGELACKADCTLDPSECTKKPLPSCGNGALDTGEECDGALLGGKDCPSLGYIAGTLDCKSDCTLSAAGCVSAEDCASGQDEDKDGAIDCSDFDCKAAPGCNTGAETRCDNAVDEDFDGLIDCGDPDDCQGLAVCKSGQTPVGGPCDSPADCAAMGDDPFCISDALFGWPGGACSDFCDLFASDCAPGALCLDAGLKNGAGLCVDACQTSADCRPGYTCQAVPGIGSVCFPIPESCTNGADDDADGLTDCKDASCDDDGACVEYCNNNIDDDGDGRVDCADGACADTIACAEVCGNGGDDDGNNLIDCADPDCVYTYECAVCGDGIISGDEQCEPPASPGCNAECEAVELACNNLVDEDNDGLIDCMDPTDCKSAGLCVPGNVPTGAPCTENNGCVANNTDPFCLSEMFGFTGGYCSEFCDIFADDCSPGAVCLDIGASSVGLCFDACQQDADCRPGYGCGPGACVPVEEVCGNGVDDDNDNLVDCMDLDDCPACEVCNNGVDDNFNGFIDCEDTDCAVDPGCQGLITQLCAGAIPLANGVPTGGDTAAGSSVFASYCVGSGAPEQVYSFTPGSPGESGEVTIDLQSPNDIGFYVRGACSDPMSEAFCTPFPMGGFWMPVTGGVPLTIIVDSTSPFSAGPFTLTASFTPAVCGDGIINGTEECDPPDGVTCDNDCTVIQENLCQNLMDDDNDGLVDCEDQDDCHTLGLCAPGVGATGSPCTANTDCAANNDDPICIAEGEFPSFVGGYCSEFCDLMLGDCAFDAVCINAGVSQFNGICFDACQADADCRPGYACTDPGFGVLVCMPL
jgi:hypothetical protein